MSRKPRADALLKTLPDARQDSIAEYARSHTLAETVDWLRADGITTNRQSLSQWLSWYALRQQFKQDEVTTDALLEALKEKVPALTDAELDELGQRTFSLLAIRNQDLGGFVQLRSAMTRAQLERQKIALRERAVALSQERLALEREKWVQESCEKILAAARDARAREIAESSVSNEEKIRLLRQTYFADVDKLEQSGEVKLPQ